MCVLPRDPNKTLERIYVKNPMSTVPTWHPRAVTTTDLAVLSAEPHIQQLHHYMCKQEVLREHPSNGASAPDPVLKEFIATDNVSEASLHC